MKRVHILLVGFALCAAAAVSYDSHVIKSESVQVVSRESPVIMATNVYACISIEMPIALIVDAPDLGRPASNYKMVSEELADLILMRIRPPPEKVQKIIHNTVT